MIKYLFSIAVFALFFNSCHKHGCDPGMMNQKFDVGFYRGPDMRQEADYVSVDGGVFTVIPTPETNDPTASCSTPGILHFSLSPGTHSIIFRRGADGPSQSLILSSKSATLDGQPLQMQSCNNGLSVVIEDI